MRNTLEIFNANIIYSNFAGQERRIDGRTVNDAGNRNFNVILDPEQSEIYWNGELVNDPNFGQQLADAGFNVKIKPGVEEGDPIQYKLPVAVSYKSEYKPELFMVVNGRKIKLDEETVGQLDQVDVKCADIVINNGKTYIDNKTGQEKVKAWCNKGYFTIVQSRIDSRYDEYEEQ